MSSAKYESLPLSARHETGAHGKWPSLRRSYTITLLVLLVFIFFYMLGIYIWLFVSFIFAELMPQTTPARAEILAVGFDVTESFSTTSIRTPSGSVIRLAACYGQPNYQVPMKRLGLSSSRHMAPPYEYWHDGGVLAGWNDIPRQLARRARKALGLPASTEARNIATMLGCLKAGAEDALPKHAAAFPNISSSSSARNLRVTHAVVSTNDFVALYDEDVRDAAEYAGVALLGDAYFAPPPRHAHAAFVGYGLNGDLTEEQLRNATGGEEEGVVKRNVVAAYLSRSALELSCEVKWTNQTCPLAWAQHLDYFGPSLGWPLEGFDESAEGVVARSQWAEGVKDLVRKCVVTEIQNKYVNGNDMNVTDVLMLGEKGGLGVFGLVIEQVLDELQSQAPRWHGLVENGSVDLRDAEWKASEGAAQMAWRVLHEPLDAYGDRYECFREQSRKLTNANGIRY